MAMRPASQGDTANPNVRTVPPAHSRAGPPLAAVQGPVLSSENSNTSGRMSAG